MPFIGLEEEEENNQQGAPNISGESTTFNNQPPGAAQSPRPQEQSRSGQYANIQQYIGANQDQAQQMGNKVVGNVEQSAQKATQGIQNLNQNIAKPTQLDPTKYLENPSSIEASDYQRLRQTGGYEGPKGLNEVQNFNNISRNAQRATQKVSAVGSEAGLDGLLQQNYQRPDYNRGMMSLDNTLVRSNQENVGRINELQNKYSNISGMFNETATNVGNNINQAVQQAQANREKFAPAEEAAFNRLLNPINQRVDQYNQSKDGIISNVMEDFKDDTLNQATLDQLGIDINDFRNVYDLNMRNYLNQNSTQAQADNLASAEERAKYAALAQLTGSGTSRIGEQGQALNPVTFDREKFISDRDSRAQTFGQQLLPSLQSEVNQALGEAASWLNYPSVESYINSPNTPQAYKNLYNVVKNADGTKDAAQIKAAIDAVKADTSYGGPNRAMENLGNQWAQSFDSLNNKRLRRG